jgi:hypothetical protein
MARQFSTSRLKTQFGFQHPFDRLRIERGAEHLHRLGARAISELLIEVVTEGDDVQSLIVRLERYQQCDPATLRAVAGDRFPPRLTVVPR